MSSRKKPGYRVRLFLSVDLTGSSQFKSTHDQSTWLKVFADFYNSFPSIFIEEYTSMHDSTPDKDSLPKIWKTIGDEIIFVNKVASVCQVSCYVKAFSSSLIIFSKQLNDSEVTVELDTKGNGWIAAFPYPNSSIPISFINNNSSQKQDMIITEELEQMVDKEPHFYDFLGKGIDAGFRIAKHSTINSFTISAALALFLCRAAKYAEMNFDLKIRFSAMHNYKGVANNNPYPVLSIDTSRCEDLATLDELQSDLLGTQHLAKDTNFHDKLEDYLIKYLEYHKIEIPVLKNLFYAPNIDDPDTYYKWVENWESELQYYESEQNNQQVAADSSGPDSIKEIDKDVIGVIDELEVNKT